MNPWARLEQVINLSGLTINSFAQSIGLKRAENLYQIKKGKNSISKDLAELIVSKYCTISKAWLITGEGSMFTEKNKRDGESLNSSRGIPFYGSISAGEAGSSAIKFSKPLYYLEIPSLSNCDFAITNLGDSMSPDIPPGAIVTLKKLDISSILPGEIYLVVTNDYSTIKRIRTSHDNDLYLRLVPINVGTYDEAVVEKSMIRHLFLVKGVVSLKIY
jgi:phage repressor protein C with HTH and peptisase S24 domain